MATEAQKFVEQHGYQQASQESKLVSMGYNLENIRQKSGGWGNNLNPGELSEITSQFQSPLQAQGQAAQQQLQTIGSQQYEFDPQQFLPGINQQAESIFAPQQAQLEAIRQLQSSQFAETTLTTEEQFDKQLQSEIESINNRGAYFGGGAIQREGEIGDQKNRALTQLGLQAQAADFGNLAQQAGLSAEQTQFVQDRLYNAEAGAYNRWSDQRNFLYGAAKDQYAFYQEERNFLRDSFESDRSFDQSARQFEANYDLDKQQMDLTKDRFTFDKFKYGQDYALDIAQFNLSKAKSYAGQANKDEMFEFGNLIQDNFAEKVDENGNHLSGVRVGDDGFMRQEDFRLWTGSAYATAGGDMDKMKDVNEMATMYLNNFTNPRDLPQKETNSSDGKTFKKNAAGEWVYE